MVKGEVCKTSIHRFESGRRLQPLFLPISLKVNGIRFLGVTRIHPVIGGLLVVSSRLPPTFWPLFQHFTCSGDGKFGGEMGIKLFGLGVKLFGTFGAEKVKRK